MKFIQSCCVESRRHPEACVCVPVHVHVHTHTRPALFCRVSKFPGSIGQACKILSSGGNKHKLYQPFWRTSESPPFICFLGLWWFEEEVEGIVGPLGRGKSRQGQAKGLEWYQECNDEGVRNLS